MPNTSFFVFVDDNDDTEARIISKLQAEGFCPLVDSVNAHNENWFAENMKCPHRLFSKHGDAYEYGDVSEWGPPILAPPILAVCFNMDTIITGDEWLEIIRWVKYQCFGINTSDGWGAAFADNFLERPIKAEEIRFDTGAETDHKESDFYDLKTHYIDEKDIMIYQVTKPNTDCPYTVVVRNYKQRGHTPFFSSLFVCSSWGVCCGDISFLHQVWTHLEQEGEFDLDRLLKEHTERCTPGNGTVESEPEVYRRSMFNVMTTIAQKNKGFIIR